MNESDFEECTDKLVEMMNALDKILANIEFLKEDNLKDVVNPLQIIHKKVNKNNL